MRDPLRRQLSLCCVTSTCVRCAQTQTVFGVRFMYFGQLIFAPLCLNTPSARTHVHVNAVAIFALLTSINENQTVFFFFVEIFNQEDGNKKKDHLNFLFLAKPVDDSRFLWEGSRSRGRGVVAPVLCCALSANRGSAR